METMFVGSDLIVEIYRFALQMLVYVLGSAAAVVGVGCLLSMTFVVRNLKVESRLLRVDGAEDAEVSVAGRGTPERRGLYLVRSQV